MFLRRATALAFAVAVAATGGRAAAQSRACPPCGPNDRCVDGVCLPPSDAPPPSSAPPPTAVPGEPVPAPAPPADPAPALPTEVTPAAPSPRPTRSAAKTHRPERHVDNEYDEDGDDDDTPAWRKGVLMLPFIGLHAVEGIAANDYDAGLRVGGLLGTRVQSTVSLNVELAVDFLNPSRVIGTTGGQTSGHDLTIAFSPLFHGSSSLGELVVGPKLGYWSSSLTTPGAGSNEAQLSQAGMAFGFNLGAFAGLNEGIALGAMLSYQMTFLAQSCSRGAAVFGPSCTNDAPAPQILSFALAALF